ncbi:hypothetical protein OS187_11735 [Xanthomonadaceae bacterium JHOS43]|jgi:poly(3-hydroxybutyrate) depolymerase|nr:hypothetical protein [Xanthomonadaceae bacterium JHOS43]
MTSFFSSPIPVLLVVTAWLVPLSASAVSTGRLPPWVCGQAPLPLFFDGFETGDGVYREPSEGSGGAFPGAQTRSVTVAGQARSYYLYIPNGYPFADAVPLLMVLHGAGGAGTAPAAASGLRDVWSGTAQAGQFIVVAPVASGASGGWVPASDYPMFKAVIEDMAMHYDIDLSRVHGWGFSAGGHVMHDLALRERGSAPDIRTFAAYGVSAGVLPALVCNGTGLPGCNSFLPQVPRRIPVVLRVGNSDAYFAYVQADANAFTNAGWVSGSTLDFASFAGGHVLPPASQLQAAWQFFCPFQRLPD